MQAADAHVYKQKEWDPDLKTHINGGMWAAIQYAVCEAVTLTDEQLFDRAFAYDEGTLYDEEEARDELGLEERNLSGSLLDRTQGFIDTFSADPQTAANADPLAMAELRKLVAVRTMRLSYLSQLQPDAFENRHIDYNLVEATLLASSITESVWRTFASHAPGPTTPNQ